MWQDDLSRAEVCLQVLTHNSVADDTAREFHAELLPFFHELAKARVPFEHTRNGHGGFYNGPGHGQESVSLLLTLPEGAATEYTRLPRELMAKLGQPFSSLENDSGKRSEGRLAMDSSSLELPQISGLRW